MENVTQIVFDLSEVTNFSKDSILEPFLSRRYDIILLYIPVFLLALAANTLVIAVVIKYHYMRSVTNYFLVNLSVADLLVTLVCMPIGAWDAYTMLWSFGEITCKIAKYLQGAIMLWAYSLMGKKLCSVRPPFDNEGSCSTQQSYRLVRERKRVAWILLLLALMFAFCWLPYNTINLLIDTRNVKTRDVVESLADLKQYMLLLGHANSALNPIIYCVMSRNFRRSVKEIIFFTRINLVSKQSQRMQWVDSSGSTLRPNQQKMKMLPTLHNKRQLSRLQSSQKTTKTCAV